MTTQISKTSVAQQVIEYLKENIANRTWVVGGKIPSENELTQRLGVSRASIRLAIQQFIALGVLESLHGKGTYVRTNDVAALEPDRGGISRSECHDMTKVLEFRLIVEPETCFLAVERAGPEVLDKLRRHVSQMTENIGNSEAFIRHDMQFHIEIARASGNPLLARCMKDLFAQTVHNHKNINRAFGFKDGVYYHLLILKAFEAGDAKQARKLMTEHMRQALMILEERDHPEPA